MFRFSIRELMLITLVAALAVAAGLTQLDRQRLGKENGQLRKELKELKDYMGEVPMTLSPGGTYGSPPRTYEPHTSVPNSPAPVAFPRGGSGLPPSSFAPNHFGNPPSSNPPAFGD